MPAMIPIIIPAMNPPPIIRLKTAKGKISTSANAPVRIIIIDAKIMVNPIKTPNANAYVAPRIGSQKKSLDQNP